MAYQKSRRHIAYGWIVYHAAIYLAALSRLFLELIQTDVISSAKLLVCKNGDKRANVVEVHERVPIDICLIEETT